MKISQQLRQRQAAAHAKLVDEAKVVLQVVKDEANKVRSTVIDLAVAEAEQDNSWLHVSDTLFPELFTAIRNFRKSPTGDTEIVNQTLSDIFETKTNYQVDRLALEWYGDASECDSGKDE